MISPLLSAFSTTTATRVCMCGVCIHLASIIIVIFIILHFFFSGGIHTYRDTGGSSGSAGRKVCVQSGTGDAEGSTAN